MNDSLAKLSYSILQGPATESFSVKGPLMCPYHNLWGKSAYVLHEPFKHDPFHINALSTSGSPVLMDKRGHFFGFLNDEVEDSCLFIYDGHRSLMIQVPNGQSLFVAESTDTDQAWKIYNSIVLNSNEFSEVYQPQHHWVLPEYCTWVEQKREASRLNIKPGEAISELTVLNYIERIEKLGLPPGKLTIDDGWTSSPASFGDWISDETRFPNIEKLFKRISDAGFVPGLWLAPVWVHCLSKVAKQHPEWVGPTAVLSTGEPNNLSPTDNRKELRHYWNPGEGLDTYLGGILERYISMGVRKFKLDMAYGDKALMKRLHKLIYQKVKHIDATVEMEIHHPDIFFCQYGDSVRTNDVLCNDQYDWRELTQAHFEVCMKSAPGKIINLDHIGGNDPNVSAANFLEHLAMYSDATGYPVVSLLPDHLGSACQESLRGYLNDYIESPNAISTFYEIID